jgi:predicted nucleic acid-binding protein
MIVYLDANFVIYLVERNPVWWPKVSARMAALKSSGDDIAVSDATRMECLVGPFRSGNATVLADYLAFFSDPAVQVIPLTTAVCVRAAKIRAAQGFSSMDALNLAAAVEHGCGLFLTNDASLKICTDITVEVLT